jgi:nucleotidyltransferase substrate binding protein (TIGR01987 family)
MERLDLRFNTLVKAYGRLEYMSHKFLDTYNRSHQISMTFVDDEPDFVVYRDALIKRFEFCYDLTWKYFKMHLAEHHKVEVSSPLEVFKECLSQGLVSQEEAIELIKMRDARNNTSHLYNEEIAREISLKIVEFFTVLNSVIHRMGQPKGQHRDTFIEKSL